jgi:exonuclease SbcC
MKLLEFEYKNILSYGNKLQSFKFKDAPTLILVEGENGAGKSSIKEAITVGIYGKSAIRKTKDIPNWINQNAYTNVKFLTSSGELVSLSRGIDPNFSNIEIDGATFNLPDKRKVDEFIEEELTKLPFSVFCNTISLSFDDFKSFVNLSKDDKRKIVDRIFGIDNLTQMRTVVKDDLKELSKEIDILDRQIQKNRLLLENSNNQLEEFTKKLNDDIQSKIDDAKWQKESKSTSLEEVKAEYAAFKEQLDRTKEEINAVNNDISQKRFTANDLNKKLDIYQKNRCPHCLNDLTSEASVQTKEKIKEKIAEFTEQIKPLEEKVEEVKKIYSKLEEEQNSKRSEFYQIKADVDSLDAKIQFKPIPPHPKTRTLSPNLIFDSLLTTLKPVESPHPNNAPKSSDTSLGILVIRFSETMLYSENVVTLPLEIFLPFQI